MVDIFRRRNSEKKLWEKQEERLESLSGGKRQKGSGNGVFEKGDIKTKYCLIEAKSTKNKSISIKLDFLKKIVEESIVLGGRIPALAITFEETNYEAPQDWIMVPAGSFFELLEKK